VTLQPWVDLPLLTAMAAQPGTTASYLTSQSGEVWRVVDGTAPELVLDLTAVVSPYVNGSERGLLGIAFNPVDGRMFLSYTDGNIDSHVVSYAVDAAGRPDPATALEVIFVDQPGLGHKGGSLVFEPNGTLYVALGDGGASNGQDAQDMTKLLGGIVRIVPRRGAAGYEVPADNPYVADPAVLPEIWAKGLRNPWGFCRDAPTGNLWLADVGNNTMEEIDRLAPGVAGANFGWPFLEGTDVRRDGAPPGAIPPVHAYRHDEIGPAAIGGCVYRGTAIPALAGAYVFGDLTGALFAIGAGDEVVRLAPAAGGILTGFGTRPDGEMVVLTLRAGAVRLVPG
jgi:Glucose / Sorbosone dehydrogenase